jgi:acyl carrier protein
MSTALTGTQIQEALRQVVPDADVGALAPDEPLRDALEMDSLDFLSFVEHLSSATGVRIDEDDYPNLLTFESCVRFLQAGASTGVDDHHVIDRVE